MDIFLLNVWNTSVQCTEVPMLWYLYIFMMKNYWSISFLFGIVLGSDPEWYDPNPSGPETVLRIHDMLVWIWIRGFLPLTNESGFGSGSCYFRYWPLRRQQKTKFLNKIFCLLLFEGTFTSFFKEKKSKRSRKTVGIKVFLTVFAWWYKDPDPDLWQMDPDPGGPKTCGSRSATLPGEQESIQV